MPKERAEGGWQQQEEVVEKLPRLGSFGYSTEELGFGKGGTGGHCSAPSISTAAFIDLLWSLSYVGDTYCPAVEEGKGKFYCRVITTSLCNRLKVSIVW
uniref:Uncharacterized protein n=1 Tax=Arundo donax TaxID=35708 RepID=A0A0A9HLV3_ARUDO